MTEREWYLIGVDRGTFSAKCDHCPRIVTRVIHRIKSRLTDQIMEVGRGCSFELTGNRDARPEPEVTHVNDGTDGLDWMG